MFRMELELLHAQLGEPRHLTFVFYAAERDMFGCLEIQLWRIDSQLSVIIPRLIDRTKLVTLSISYVRGG